MADQEKTSPPNAVRRIFAWLADPFVGRFFSLRQPVHKRTSETWTTVVEEFDDVGHAFVWLGVILMVLVGVYVA